MGSICTGFDPGAGANVLVNLGRGATFGVTDDIANFISPGASCTVKQNTSVQLLGAAATMFVPVGALGGAAAKGAAGGAKAGTGAAKSGALTERAIGSTMDDVLRGSTFYKQSGVTQYVKPGGFSKANADFDALAQGVTVVERAGGLRTATLSNGTKISVRPFSSAKSVTLDVRTPGNPVLKIRYTP